MKLLFVGSTGLCFRRTDAIGAQDASRHCPRLLGQQVSGAEADPPPPPGNACRHPVRIRSRREPTQGKRQLRPQLKAPQVATRRARNRDAAAPANDNEPLTTITKRVDEVNVVFTVTDKRGKFVKDLKQNDFQVVDDNKPGQRSLLPQ